MTRLALCVLVLPLASSSALAAETPAALLERARALVVSIDYEAVAPLTEQVIAHPDATLEHKLEAYFLQGEALAIVGQVLAAELPFRYLLAAAPEFEPPASASPKVIAVFRKVQVEQRAIAARQRALERDRLIAQMALSAAPVDRAVGGEPLQLSFHLRDPRGAAAHLRLHYRKTGEPEYGALPLRFDEHGWSATLAADWTASEQGLDLEYFVTTADAEGTSLISLADAREPLRLYVAPGLLVDSEPFYRRPAFWITVGVGAVLAAGATWLYVRHETRIADSPLGNAVVP